MDKPQIICHSETSATFSLFDCKWVPCSARFVVLGSKPNGRGVIQIYEIIDGVVTLTKEVEKSKAFRCGTFAASRLIHRHLATGDFDGKLHVWNLEETETPVYSANAHSEIINCIDGIGGASYNCGACEIVTGSRDGKVKVWDVRLKDKPVAIMDPVGDHRDCWTVAFGNSYNNEERVVCAGYDNGDVKMFDLKSMSVKWETNLKNGVCGMEFDRRDIEMNKLVATTLESKFYLFDLRTQHPKQGFTSLKEKAHKSTVWLGRHLPQNRDIFITCGGGGSIMLWKYEYPDKRCVEDSDGNKIGKVGELKVLNNCTLSTQPVSSFDWSPDKIGLAVCTSFDQTIRTILITKLNLQ